MYFNVIIINIYSNKERFINSRYYNKKKRNLTLISLSEGDGFVLIFKNERLYKSTYSNESWILQ